MGVFFYVSILHAFHFSVSVITDLTYMVAFVVR
jgi:hypothetical protein